MKTAIFGGSFDPAHRGHYEIVRRALDNAYVEKVVVVPARRNPLKDSRPVLSDKERRLILEELFNCMSKVEISFFELEKDDAVYTCETLSYFKKKYPKDEIYLLLGEDAFAYFHLWAEIELILELSRILVFPRPGLRREHPGPFLYNSSDRVKWLDVEIPNISASQIRRSSISVIEENSWLTPGALDIWRRRSRKGGA